MTVDDWVLTAVSELGRGNAGATLRAIQRYIDDQHHEELATDTIEASLAKWMAAGKISEKDGHFFLVKATSKEDAMRRLFND
jgi:hypothetical protein